MVIDCLNGGSPACDAYVDEHPQGMIYHKSGIQEVIKRALGHDSLYLCARSKGKIKGVLPLIHMHSVVFGNFLISVPFFNYGGVCADDEATEKALLEQAVARAKKLGSAHIELRHSRSVFPELQQKTHKVAMILDLPENADDLMASFKSKLRSQIRRPTKEGVYTKIGKLDLLDDFYDVFSVNMRDLGTPVYGKRFFRHMLTTFPSRTWIVAAYKDEQPIAAGFLLGYKETVEIPWASSLREFNRLSANMLMYFDSLKLAVEQGYKKFDFGRSTPDEGTYKFKAQWGSQPLPLFWEYWLPSGATMPDLSPTNGKYGKAIEMWQKLPIPVTKILGPRIVKNLP